MWAVVIQTEVIGRILRKLDKEYKAHPVPQAISKLYLKTIEKAFTIHSLLHKVYWSPITVIIVWRSLEKIANLNLLMLFVGTSSSKFQKQNKTKHARIVEIASWSK